jgi:outer membrane protein insertion porin family
VSDIEQSNIRIAALTPFLMHNTLERDFDPRRGRRLTLAVEAAGRALGGNVNTIRPYFDYRQFIAFGPFELSRGEPRVFGFRLRAAHIAAFGEPFLARTLSQVDGVPIFNRFFLGGETEVRGYEVNSIAPLARVDRLLVIGGTSSLLATDIRPIGGDTLMIANAEYRVPVTSWLSTAAFFDLGAAFNARKIEEQRFESPTLLQPGDVPATIVTVLRPLANGIGDLPNYRVSIGVELRFRVPAFNLPLRLIFAYNPNAQRNPADPLLLAPERRFVFRIGFGRTL